MKKPSVHTTPASAQATLNHELALGDRERARVEALGFSAIVLTAALVLFGCLTFTWHANRLLSRYDDHRRTSEISSTLLNISSNVHSIETGKQGYQLSGSPRFMAPFQQGGLELRKNLALLDRLIAPDDRESRSLVARLRTLTAGREIDATAGSIGGEFSQGGAYRTEVPALLYELNAHARQRQAQHDHATEKAVREAKYLFVAWVAAITAGFGLALSYGAKGRRVLTRASGQLTKAANHDVLTGLPNRRYLSDYLREAFDRARSQRQALTLLYFDLDGFSGINNSLGHEAGDEALVWSAQSVRAEIRSTDFLARLGGDEFVIVSSGITLQQAKNLADRLLAKFSAGSPLETAAPGTLGLSIGIARMQEGESDPDGLLARSDAAMYEAKRAGKRCWRVAKGDNAPSRDPVPERAATESC